MAVDDVSLRRRQCSNVDFPEPLLGRIIRTDLQSHTKGCTPTLADQLRQTTVGRAVYIRRPFPQVLETLQYQLVPMPLGISSFELDNSSFSDLDLQSFPLNLGLDPYLGGDTDTVQSALPNIDFIDPEVFSNIFGMDFTSPRPVEDLAGIASQEGSVIASPVPSTSTSRLPEFCPIDPERVDSTVEGPIGVACQGISKTASPAPSHSLPTLSVSSAPDREPDTRLRHGSPAVASQEGSMVLSSAPPSPMSSKSSAVDHEPNTSSPQDLNTPLCEYVGRSPFSENGQQTRSQPSSCDTSHKASPQDPKELPLDAIVSNLEAHSQEALASTRESEDELHPQDSPTCVPIATPSPLEPSGPEMASTTASSPEAAPQNLPMPSPSAKARELSVCCLCEGGMHSEAANHGGSGTAETEPREVLAVAALTPAVSLENVDLDSSTETDPPPRPDSTRTSPAADDTASNSTSLERVLGGAVNRKSTKRLMDDTQQGGKSKSTRKLRLEKVLILTVLPIVIVSDDEDEDEEADTTRHRQKRRRLEKGLDERNILKGNKSSHKPVTRTGGQADPKPEYNQYWHPVGGDRKRTGKCPGVKLCQLGLQAQTSRKLGLLIQDLTEEFLGKIKALEKHKGDIDH